MTRLIAEVRRSVSGDQPFYLRVKAGNGKIVFTTETYKAKRSVLKAAHALMKAGANIDIRDKTR